MNDNESDYKQGFIDARTLIKAVIQSRVDKGTREKVLTEISLKVMEHFKNHKGEDYE